VVLCREGHASVYDWVCFFTAEEEDGEDEGEGVVGAWSLPWV